MFGELTQTDGEDAGPTVDTLDAAEDSGLTGLSGAVTQPDPAGMSDMDDIEGAAGVTAGGADDELLGLEGLDELEGPDGLGDLDDPFAAPKAQAKKKTTAPFEDLGASPDAEGDLASGDDLDLSEGFGAISPAAEADGDDDLATIDFSDGVEDTGDELGFETEPPPPAKAAAKPAPVAARAPDPLADLGLDDQLDFGPEDASASDPLADLDLEGGGDPLADLGMSDADADPLAGLGLDDDAAPVATAKTAESDEKDGDDLLDDDSIGDELDISEAPTKDPDSAGAFLDEDDLLGELDVAESAAPPEPDLFEALDEAENAAKPAARTPSALDDADLLAELDLAEDAAPAEPDLLDELEMTEDGPRAPAADLAMDDDGLPPAPDGFLDEPLGELSMEADAPLDLPPPAAEKDPLGAFDLEGELALEDGGNSLPAPATDENEDALELDGEFPGFDDLSPDEEADLLATPQPAPRRAAGVALEPEPDELQSEAEDFTTAAAARVAALNRALVGLTMAKDLSSALRRAAPALAAAGLTKALILVQDGKQAKPICVWKADGATPPLLEEQNLYGYVTQGLVAGLSRYADGWQAAYDAARAVDFKPLAAWQSPGARLMAGAFDGKNAKRLIVFGAWPEATDAATLDAAIAVLRRVAAHA